MIKSKSGFTIVEMVVVIAVIGILAAITIITYDNIQMQARDSKRISDLAKISDAIQLYRQKNGNDVQSGSGCGGNGNGNGWFNHTNGTGGSYPKSILSCLVDAGYLDDSFIDPTGCTYGSTTYGCPHFYMKYSCVSGGQMITHIYARLETKDDSQKLIDSNTCSSSAVESSYGMNYMVVAD